MKQIIIQNFLKVVYLFETVIFFILSYLIPKNPKLVLFGCRKGTAIIGSPRVYYLYLKYLYKSNDELELLFYDRLGINSDPRINTYGDSFRKYFLLLRAKHIIIDNCSFDVGMNGVLLGNVSVIQTWHGEPIKSINFLSPLYLKKRSFITLFFELLEYKNYKYILSNKKTTSIMEKCFRNTQAVIGIGLPRNDIFLDKEVYEVTKNIFVQNYILEQRKQYKKIFLYSPTFRDSNNSNFDPNQVNLLNEILKKNNSLLLVKKHPRDYSPLFESGHYSHIKNVTQTLNFDSGDFLPFIDVLVTDYSSTYIDFLLTRKPIIFFQYDLNEYIEKERGLLYDSKEVVLKTLTAYSFSELFMIFEELESRIEDPNYPHDYNALYSKFYDHSSIKCSCEELTKYLF